MSVTRPAPALRVLLAAAAVVACGQAPDTADNAGLIAALRDGRQAEVTVTGTVSALETDSTGLHGPHERFLLEVAGTAVEVDHNLSLAPRAPVRLGETVTVHGQFEPDPGHPVIHDTHHSTGSHEGGWIDADGQRYE